MENLTEEMLRLPWENKRFYASFLAQTYYFVRHSTRLLALASAYAAEDSLHRRYASHIGEEKGHDRLALNDLTRLGVQLEPELPQTRNLYEPQYYKIERQDSSALMGYILALEGVASLICPKIMDRITQAHGEECAKFLKLHVEEDPDHVDKAFAEIESLNPDLMTQVTANLIQSCANYSAMLEAVRHQTSLAVENLSEISLQAFL